MVTQPKLFDWTEPRKPEPVRLHARTYIYIRQDGKCVHVNAIEGFIGREYEHDDPNWQPGADWPYEIEDMRKDKGKA